jgi:hypothetical protein
MQMRKSDQRADKFGLFSVIVDIFEFVTPIILRRNSIEGISDESEKKRKKNNKIIKK